MTANHLVGCCSKAGPGGGGEIWVASSLIMLSGAGNGTVLSLSQFQV